MVCVRYRYDFLYLCLLAAKAEDMLYWRRQLNNRRTDLTNGFFFNCMDLLIDMLSKNDNIFNF